MGVLPREKEGFQKTTNLEKKTSRKPLTLLFVERKGFLRAVDFGEQGRLWTIYIKDGHSQR